MSIDINTQQQAPADLIQIDDTGVTLVDPAVADKRASQATFGMGNIMPNKDFDSWRTSILTGYEGNARAAAAQAIDQNQGSARIQAIIDNIKTKNGPLDIFDIDRINNKYPPADPKSVIEDQYSKTFLNTFHEQASHPDSWVKEAHAVIPLETGDEIDSGATLMAKRQFIGTKLDDNKTTNDSQSIFQRGVEAVGINLPLLGTINRILTFNEVLGTGLSPLLGNSMEDFRKKLYRLPYPQFKQTVDVIHGKLKDISLTLDQEFLATMQGQSDDEVLLNNALPVIDLATAVQGLGPAAMRKAGLFQDVRTATRDIVAAADTAEKLPVRVVAPAAAGDLSEAAVQNTTGDVIDLIKGVDYHEEPLKPMQEAFKTNAQNYRANPGNLGQEVANRIAENTETLNTSLTNALQNTIKIDRAPAVYGVETAVRAVLETVKDQYPGLRNRVINMGPIYWHGPSNSRWVDTILGTNEGTYFKNRPAANTAAVFQELEGYSIQQSGAGFYIVMPRPIDETSDAFRNLLLATKDTRIPDSQMNLFMNGIQGLRTPDDLLSPESNIARKIAMYEPNVVKGIYKRAIDSVRELMTEGQIGASRVTTKTGKKFILNRTQTKQWLDTVAAEQDLIDPVTGKKGYFFQNPAELDYYYMRNWDRLPEPIEHEAYFAFKDAMEMDLQMRNLSMFKNLNRIGAQQHRYWVTDPATSAQEFSPYYFGISQPHFPGGEEPIMFVWGEKGQESVQYPQSMNKTTKDKLQERVTKGELKVSKLVFPEHYPFYEVAGNHRIAYVISKNIRHKPLSYDIIPRRGGGHVEYDHPLYIKQARVNPVARAKQPFAHYYEGDTTLFPMSNHVLAQDVVKDLNLFRLSYETGTDVEKVAIANRIPVPYEELDAAFKPGRDHTGKKIPPRLNLHEPIQGVPKDKTIFDIDNALPLRYPKTFKDGTKMGPGRQMNIPFTQERDAYDLMTINNEGTRYNPVFKYEPATKVDPLTSMNRALNRIVDSLWMDDLKIREMEHWLEEAKLYLNALPEEIRGAPLWYFHKGEYKNGVPPEIKHKLENARLAIKQLTAIDSDASATMRRIQQQLADTIYKLPTDEPMARAAVLAAPHALALLSSGPKFLRAATFHSTMFLSIPQLFVQSMSWATIAAVLPPQHVIPTMTANILHQLSRMNRHPSVLRFLDEFAQKFGWKPGEWLEVNTHIMNGGFKMVSGEHIVLDNTLYPNVIEHAGTRILDAGLMFFKGPERNIRFGSFYGAYKMLRDIKPTGRLTNHDRAWILNTADTMAGNMTSASKSMLQTGKGLEGVLKESMTQFLSWTLRTAELMYGKRLTGMQKLRMIMIYGTLFGMPATTGLSGLPGGDIMRQYAQQHGYIVGEKFWSSMLMEGGPAMLGAVITGGGDFHKGTFLNIGERFGATGFDFIRQLFADGSYWKMFAGAQGSFLQNAWDQTGGLQRVVRSWLSDDKDAYFPIKPEDLLDMAKILSAGNRAIQLEYALRVGKQMTRKGNFIDTTSPGMAIFQYLTGTQQQETADIHALTLTLSDRKEAEKRAEQRVQVEVHHYLDAMRNNDPAQAADYGKRIKAVLQLADYPAEKRMQAIDRAFKSYNQSLLEGISFEFYNKDVPESQKKTMQDAWQALQQRIQSQGKQ